MQTNQEKLLSIIRESDNPEQALMLAIKMITYALEWQSSSNSKSLPDFPPLID